jgi:hypothetical protein
MWSLETTLSLITAVKEIRNFLKIDETAKDHISDKLEKRILKGNIVDFEMVHLLKSA